MNFAALRAQIDALPDATIGNGASDAAIDAAETALAVTFPPELRDYLRDFGWVSFGAHEIYGLGPGVPPESDLVRLTRQERKTAVPLSSFLVPVWNNGGGDLACVIADPASPRFGQVIRWVHEEPSGPPEVVAPDFQAWLADLATQTTGS